MKLLLCASLACFLFLSVPQGIQTVHAQPTTVNKSPDCHWGLAAYGTEIVFSDWISYTSWGYDLFPDNTRWTWYNLAMDGSTLSEFWITVENGDITINKLFNDRVFELYVDAASVATIQFSSPLGLPVHVDGAAYEYADGVVTLTKSDDGKITVSWVPEEYEWDPELYVGPYTLVDLYLVKGDFIGFLFAIWYSLIGEVILIAFAFIMFYPMYRHTESVFYPCLIMCILGGASIGLTAILPFQATWVHYVFFLIGGAGVLYRVFGERD